VIICDYCVPLILIGDGKVGEKHTPTAAKNLALHFRPYMEIIDLVAQAFLYSTKRNMNMQPSWPMRASSCELQKSRTPSQVCCKSDQLLCPVVSSCGSIFETAILGTMRPRARRCGVKSLNRVP
jgi:hypothetical protein